jgi:hypothetical protein
VIPLARKVNPETHGKGSLEEARQLADWFVSPDGQRAIGRYEMLSDQTAAAGAISRSRPLRPTLINNTITAAAINKIPDMMKASK